MLQQLFYEVEEKIKNYKFLLDGAAAPAASAAENGSSSSSTASASPTNETAEPAGASAPFRINLDENSATPVSLSQVNAFYFLIFLKK